mgnify:CR=1 FL=1
MQTVRKVVDFRQKSIFTDIGMILGMICDRLESSIEKSLDPKSYKKPGGVNVV